MDSLGDLQSAFAISQGCIGQDQSWRFNLDRSKCLICGHGD